MASEGEGPHFVKQTLLHSPIITNIFPAFNVDISKKFRGLSNNSIDESDQYLVPKEDSQMDVFADDDDDDFSLFTSATSSTTFPSAQTVNSSADASTAVPRSGSPTLTTIKILIKITSILVDNVEFAFPAPIRTSCMINGLADRDTGHNQEDSLLISLKSGFLFLIRIFYVPRHYTDKYYDISTQQKQDNFIFKPFIVQWWDTGNHLLTPALDSSGFTIHSHTSGLASVSTSASNVFRIYNVKSSDAGTYFGPHTNVPVDGIILNACFSEPLIDCIDDSHILFLTLIFTELRRLEINLFEWTARQELEDTTTTNNIDNLVKKTLPLNNSFPIPIFIIPLKKNSSFLFVSELEITIVTIHQIMSVEYDFVRVSIEDLSTFPTSFYIPFSNISDITDDKVDEVLIATDTGMIYSVLVNNNNEIKLNPIVRISDPISVFALEKLHKNEYSLIFGSDTGSNREVIIANLFSNREDDEGNSRIKKYSKTRLITDYKNWAPLMDVLIVDSFPLRSLKNHVDQELWTLSGIGKRTRLTQLRNGYNATRSGKIFSNLRKAEKIFLLNLDERVLFVLSFSYETRVFEYFDFVEEENLMLQEIGNDVAEEGHESDVVGAIQLVLNDPTLICSRINDSMVLQVTESSVCFTNLVDIPIQKTYLDRRIIFSHHLDLYLVLVSESTIGLVLTLEVYEISPEQIEPIRVIKSTDLNFEPSMAKLVKINDGYYVSLGSYNGCFKMWNIKNDDTLSIELTLDEYNPYKKDDALCDNQLLIPHDILVNTVDCESIICLGSKDGYFMKFQIDNNHSKLTCKQFLRVSDTSVSFSKDKEEDRMFYILSRNLWIVDLYKSNYPQKVFFNETTDRAIFSMVNINATETNGALKYYGFLREDGLSVGSIQTTRTPNTKHITIGEPAKKMLFLLYISTFIILCNSKTSSIFKFIDRKLLKLLKHIEYNKNKVLGNIIGEGEFAMSIHIWSIQRQDNRVSKKILVGFGTEELTKGLMRVLDITSNTDKASGEISITVTELNSFEWNCPILSIDQIDSTIFFAGGNTINSTSYSVIERKLTSVDPLITFSSSIVSMSCNAHTKELLVTTKSDSIYKCKYFENPVGLDRLQIIAKDPSPKSLVNETQLIGGDVVVADKLHSTILVMSKKDEHLCDTFNYKMSSIPRVFTGRFNNTWDGNREGEEDQNEETGSGNFLCVGVNGEITSMRKIDSYSSIFPNDTAFGVHSMKELDLPFSDKLNGKGLFSLYKPYFNYKENHSVIDLDLEALSKLGNINLTI